MSTPIVPGPGPGQYWPPTTSPAPAPPPRRKPVLLWILGGAALLALVAVSLLGARLLGQQAGTSEPTAQSQAQDVGTPLTTAAEPTTDAPAPTVTPKASDFRLTAKITKKQCFGSAGCNVEFWVSMAYGGPDLDPDDTWIVTYEVSGVEDGPQINTIEVTGDTYSHDETELASTTSSSKKLTVKVTDVEKQGI